MFVSQSLKYQLVSVSYIQGDELVVSYSGVSYKKKKRVIQDHSKNVIFEPPFMNLSQPITPISCNDMTHMTKQYVT